MAYPSLRFLVRLSALLLLLLPAASIVASGGGGDAEPLKFPMPLAEYDLAEQQLAAEMGVDKLTLWQTLKHRVVLDPLNLLASLLFLGAITHTFLSSKFMGIAHRLEHEHHAKTAHHNKRYVDNKSPVSLKATFFHFLGEVEAIFGIWLIPLFITIMVIPSHGWDDLVGYVDSRNYTEPIFVVVIMAIASSRPVILLAERSLRGFASLGKGTPAAWWLAILVVAPLLGSFITEPAAMTIAAMLLGQQFYRLNPARTLRYATLGLLFVNISVGGTLTHFAAPPVLMVADTWHWDIVFMFTHFGWRAVLGILLATGVYYLIFRKQFSSLQGEADRIAAEPREPDPEPVPVWIIFIHLGFLAWTVFTLHHPAFFVGGFLFFIAFTIATDHHQFSIQLKSPLLVGFFLAGLVTHGGLQSWWIAPVLGSLSEIPLFIGATLLTAFNDNAAITYLASLVPSFSPDQLVHGKYVAKAGADLMESIRLEYAVVAGAVTGGGLTVIANAPNPAGQSILKGFFKDGVSPLYLLLGALIPTLVMAFCFIVLPH